MNLRFFPVLAAFSMLASLTLRAEDPVAGKMTGASTEVKSDSGGKTTIAYLTSLPEGPAPEDGWPLMVFSMAPGSAERIWRMSAAMGHPDFSGKRRS